jgi:hypothetical protein
MSTGAVVVAGAGSACAMVVVSPHAASMPASSGMTKNKMTRFIIPRLLFNGVPQE